MNNWYELVKVKIVEATVGSGWFERVGEEYWAVKDNSEIALGWEQPYGIIAHLFSKEDALEELKDWNEKGYSACSDLVDDWVLAYEVTVEEV